MKQIQFYNVVLATTHGIYCVTCFLYYECLEDVIERKTLLLYLLERSCFILLQR
jgi:hypothetical protein